METIQIEQFGELARDARLCGSSMNEQIELSSSVTSSASPLGRKWQLTREDVYDDVFTCLVNRYQGRGHIERGNTAVRDCNCLFITLRAFKDTLHVTIETHRQSDVLHNVAVKEAVERYELELASLPYDLTFRAYDANCEAAWYGTEGV